MKSKLLLAGAIGIALCACSGEKQNATLERTDSTSVESAVKADDPVAGVVGIEEIATESTEKAAEEASQTAAETEKAADVDALLDKYEALTDKLIALGKKDPQEDPTTVEKLMKLSQEAQELVSEISTSAPQMTPAQSQRLQRLVAKVQSAMAVMQ